MAERMDGPHGDTYALEKRVSGEASGEGFAPQNESTIDVGEKSCCSDHARETSTIEVLVDSRSFDHKPRGVEVGSIRKRLAGQAVSCLPFDEFRHAVERGCAFMPGICLDGTSAEKWTRQSLFLLDFDNKGKDFDEGKVKPVGIKEAVDRCVDVGIGRGFWYKTWSSSEKRLAFRLGFVFSEVITDRDLAKAVVDALLALFPEADQSCRDLSRMYFGTCHPVSLWNRGEVVGPEALLERIRANHGAVSAVVPTEAKHDGVLGLMKDSFDLLGLIRADTGEDGRTGGDIVYFARCPICGHSDCFRFYPATNTWHCFSASAEGNCGGSAIDYLMRTRGLSQPEAIRRMMGLTGSGDLDCTPRGGIATICQVIGNLGLSDGIAFNEREVRPYAKAALPWVGDGGHPWDDADDAELRRAIQETGTKFRNADYRAAFTLMTRSNRYDPFREALESLPRWDGVERLGRLGSLFLGIEDCEYSRAAERLVFFAILARTYQESVKFDYMLVYFGKQGIGKSTFACKLALYPRYFGSDLRGIGERTAAELIQGKVIVEVPELAAFDAKTVEAVKAFITRESDDYRIPYGKFPSRHPRRCVLVGSTNTDTFLRDRTGNRRFLPLECGFVEPKLSLFTGEADYHFRQAWAEALQAYRRDGAILTLSPEMESIAREKQDEATLEDPRVEQIRAWLQGSKNPGDYVATPEVIEYALHVPQAQRGMKLSREVRTILLNCFPGLLVSLPGKKKFGRYGSVRVFQVI